MKSILKGFGHFLAIVAAILFVITMTVAFPLHTIDGRLFNPRTYKTILAGQQVYDRLPRVLAEQLTMSMTFDPCADNPFLCENPSPEFKDCVVQAIGEVRYESLRPGDNLPTSLEKELIRPCVDRYLPQAAEASQGGAPAFMKNLTAANWETILIDLIPPDSLRLQTEDIIDQVFAYLDGRQGTVAISMVDLKERISGQAGVDAMRELILAQPACSPEAADIMIASIQDGSAPESFCNPSQERLAQVTPSIEDLLAKTVAGLPDERTLLTPETGENSEQGGLVASFGTLRFILRLSLEVPLALLLLITLLMVRTPRSWLRWWGIPLFISGLLLVILALLASFSFDQLWLTLLSSQVPDGFSLGVVEMVRGLASALVRRITVTILVWGLIFGLAGLGMWIGSIFTRKEPGLPPA